MNVRLDSVISNIMGKSGLAILGAIVEGDREPAASGDVAESPHQGFGGSGGRKSGRDMAQGASDNLKEDLKHCDFIDHRIGILKRTVQAELKALAKTSDEKSASTSDSPSVTSYSAPNSILGAKDFDRNSRTGRARLAQDLPGCGFDSDSDHRGEDDNSGRHRNRSRFDLFLPDARAFLFPGAGASAGKIHQRESTVAFQGKNSGRSGGPGPESSILPTWHCHRRCRSGHRFREHPVRLLTLADPMQKHYSIIT